MKKVWYIQIDNRIEGPFSYDDLKNDRRLTPDSLVWREGFDKWLPISQVPELRHLFTDETPQPVEPLSKEKKKTTDELIVLAMNQPPYLFWLLIALILLLYSISYLFWYR